MDFQTIKDQIPYYLTRQAADGLIKELESYNGNTAFYTNRYPSDFLQGDGWRGFEIFDFEVDAKRTIRGIVVSNSCDISTDNPRDIPAKVSFVPIFKLKNLKAIFENSGMDPKVCASKIQAIKEQKNTSFFFLPAQGAIQEEYVAFFSDIYSMPTHKFFQNTTKTKLFTLNMTGFYLFLLKLSIHFCRFHENVDRSMAPPAVAL